MLFARVHRQTMAKTRGNYPAPERIIEVVRKGFEQGVSAGFVAEARAFGELVVSPQSRQLIHMFFATRELAKENGVDDPHTEARAVDSVGLLGAGLMGAGIAYLCAARAGTSVTVRESDQESLDAGIRRWVNGAFTFTPDGNPLVGPVEGFPNYWAAWVLWGLPD